MLRKIHLRQRLNVIILYDEYKPVLANSESADFAPHLTGDFPRLSAQNVDQIDLLRLAGHVLESNVELHFALLDIYILVVLDITIEFASGKSVSGTDNDVQPGRLEPSAGNIRSIGLRIVPGGIAPADGLEHGVMSAAPLSATLGEMR